MYISKKDFNLIYSAYFTMTEVLADFDDIMTEEEDEEVINGQKKLIEIARKEYIKEMKNGGK